MHNISSRGDTDTADSWCRCGSLAFIDTDRHHACNVNLNRVSGTKKLQFQFWLVLTKKTRSFGVGFKTVANPCFSAVSVTTFLLQYFHCYVQLCMSVISHIVGVTFVKL